MAHVQHQQALHLLGDTKADAVRKSGVVAPMKRHGSLQPQDNDMEDADESVVKPEPTLIASTTRKEPTTDAKSKPHSQPKKSQPTLVPSLETICSLTKRIDSETNTNLLSLPRATRAAAAADRAALYCQRSTVLLEYTKYDALASIPLTLLEAVDSHIAQCDELSDSDSLEAVQQALDDALAAISLDARCHTAYILAARCSRCLGKPAHAMDYTVHALQVDPHSSDALQLMRELRADLDDTRLDYAPPFLCRSVEETENLDDGDDQQQQQQTELPHEDTEDDSILSRFKAMERLASSPLLRSLERTMHESVHHQCASSDDIKALATAFDNTVALLQQLLLDDEETAQAILMERHELVAIAQQLQNSQCVANTPSIRKWIVKTLVPAVMQSIPERDDTFFPSDFIAGHAWSRAAMLHDVLVMVTRLLLVTGKLQRCTMMPHALASTKMAYDLAKLLLSTSSSSHRRLEMVCADAYAVALLELTEEAGEALVLHQETLEAAIRERDAVRELQCHQHLGRALIKLREYDVARSEFQELLVRSQAQSDSVMECTAWYHLGEIQLAVGYVEEAMGYFDKAVVLCNQSGRCRGTWRPHSVENATAFYAYLRPTRRGAVGSRTSTKFKANVVVPTPPPAKPAMVAPYNGNDHDDYDEHDDYWAWPEEEQQQQQSEKKKEISVVDRRATVWMSSSPLAAQSPTAADTEAHSISLLGRLISQTPSRPSMDSPPRPECWKPRA